MTLFVDDKALETAGQFKSYSNLSSDKTYVLAKGLQDFVTREGY